MLSKDKLKAKYDLLKRKGFIFSLYNGAANKRRPSPVYKDYNKEEVELFLNGDIPVYIDVQRSKCVVVYCQRGKRNTVFTRNNMNSGTFFLYNSKEFMFLYKYRGEVPPFSEMLFNLYPGMEGVYILTKGFINVFYTPSGDPITDTMRIAKKAIEKPLKSVNEGLIGLLPKQLPKLNEAQSMICKEVAHIVQAVDGYAGKVARYSFMSTLAQATVEGHINKMDADALINILAYSRGQEFKEKLRERYVEKYNCALLA